MSFKNSSLSYSRISRFESCPLSFKFHYVEKQPPEPGDPLRFGSVVHAALERLLGEVIAEERSGPLSEERALALLRDEWAKENLTGLGLFEEGGAILKRFVADQGVVDHRDLLAVEKEFEIRAGEFLVRGFIDRVDRIDDETIEIVDYKTNRQLFTREEVDQSLQMSLYYLAAQRLWPWAKKVKLTFHMLRHGVRMGTQRTPEQVEAALAYVVTVGRMTEEATAFPPLLGPNCVYCDHRRRCPAYAEALKGKREFACESKDDLEAVAKEREEVATLAKLLYARKEELEAVLKAHLKEHDELVLGGVRYRMFNATKVDYPSALTVKLVSEATGVAEDKLIERITTIDKKALDGVLKDGRLDRARVNLLKAELEAHAQKTYMPRFWAKGE